MKHTRFFAFCIALVLCIPPFNGADAQSIAINNSGLSADGSAMLDVSSITKGLLAPRMDSAQRAAISAPATGLLVYQTDGTMGLYYYNGTVWQLVGRGADGWTVIGTNIYAANSSGTTASGIYSTATGNNTTASGDYTTAMGSNVSTNNYAGSFIIGDSTAGAITNCTAADQMMMRFSGGYILYTNDAASSGIQLTSGGVTNYLTDVAGSYTIRSLVDKNYVDSTVLGGGAGWTVSGTNISAANGSVANYLTNVAGSYTLHSLVDKNYVDSTVLGGGAGWIVSGTNISAANGSVANYLTNVAGSYTLHSLVDKNYVDSTVLGGGAGWTVSGTNIYAANGSVANYPTNVAGSYTLHSLVDKNFVDSTVRGGGAGWTVNGTNIYAANSSGTYAIGGYSTATGYDDTASGVYSTALGQGTNAKGVASTAMGYGTTASGNYTTAMGYNVSTNNYLGSFIIGDDDEIGGTTTHCTSANQMVMRFGGGYVLYTNDDTATGVQFTSAGVANYLTNVAGSYTLRSLVDKNFVDSTLGVTGGGWTVSGTNINAASGSVANYLTDVAGSYTLRSLVDKNFVDSTLGVTGGGWTVSGTNINAASGSVANYPTNVAGSYTLHSLVDKNYVDSTVLGGGAGWTVSGTNIYAANSSGNYATGGYSTAMGFDDTASGQYSTAIGIGTKVSGNYSTAMGYNTIASGELSTAMGTNVSTNNFEGSFIIGDYYAFATTHSTATNQMVMRFGGGYKFYTNDDTATGIQFTSGGVANYLTDVAGSYTLFSLVDKNFVDSTVLNGGAGWTVNGTNIYAANSSGNYANTGYSTAMGYDDTASGQYSTAMGYGTNATGLVSTAMGYNTTASNNYTTAMGQYTTASGGSSIAIGNHSTASGSFASVAIGYYDTSGGDASVAIGYEDTATGNYSVAIGQNTDASGSSSTALGSNTIASGNNSTAIGNGAIASGTYSNSMGFYTTASGQASTALGLYVNTNGYDGSFIIGDDDYGGGTITHCTAANQMVMRFGGGYKFYTNDDTATGIQFTSAGVAKYLTNVAGSYTLRSLVDKNYVDSTLGVTGGGWTVNGTNIYTNGNGAYSSGGYSIAMGNSDTANSEWATAMGTSTTANAFFSTAMGVSTIASGVASTAMGNNTTASGVASTAMGSNTTASGGYSTAMGNNVSTNNYTGSFIIGDDIAEATITHSTAANQMVMRFGGGYNFYTNDDTLEGVSLAAGGNSWSTISDRRRKENFAAVNGEDFLKKIDGFSLTSWNYKGQDAKIFRHYGPMAQDFYAAFGKDSYGTIGNDTTINQADFEGVSFIAIQALERRTKEQAEEIKELKAQLADQNKENTELKAEMSEKDKAIITRLEAVEASLNEKLISNK